MEKEFNLKPELEKWFRRWNRKRVTGRCLIELKERDREFIKRLKEELFWENEDLIPDNHKVIDKLAGEKFVQ